jgi:hypothetical protein
LHKKAAFQKVPEKKSLKHTIRSLRT